MKNILLLLICSICLQGCQPKDENVIQLVQEPSYSASLSSNAKYAVISTANSGVQLWALDTQQLKYTWHNETNQNNVIDTHISPNNRYAATLSKDSVALWKMNDGKSLGWWSLPSSGQSVAVANNGALLIGLNNGSVMSLDSVKGSLIQFLGHNERINSVALSADGRFALSGSNDQQAILWHATTGQPIHKWQFNSRVIKVALSQNGALSFAGDSTNDARIWNNQSGQELSRLNIKRRKMNFSAARFINNDSQLLTGTPAREVLVWQNDSGKKIATWKVKRTKKAKTKGAVVYSVSHNNIQSVTSISSNGLVESWPLLSH